MTYPPDRPPPPGPGSPQGEGPHRGGPQPPHHPPPGPPPSGWQPAPPPQWGPPQSNPQQPGPPGSNTYRAAPQPPWQPAHQQPWQQAQQPPWQGGQPPRRSRAGLIAAVAAVLVAAIALATVLVVNSNKTRASGPDDGAPAVTAPRTTAPRTTTPRTTAPRTTVPRTTAPRTTASRTTVPRTTAPRTTTPRTTTPRTTAPRTTAPRTTTPRTSTPAQNNPQPMSTLADNPFLQDPDSGLKNLVCNLPAWKSTPAAAESFFRAQTKCLDAAWGPLLKAYDMPFSSPVLHFPQGSSFDTECGVKKVGIATAAYYCDGNLFVPFRGLQTDLYGNDPGVYMALFAHEYGHHVQLEAGLLGAAAAKMRQYGVSSAKGLDISRRQELQAQCFSGMFLGSHAARGGTITRAMFDRAWQDQETRGDGTSGTHDHGTNAHYAAWWREGAKNNRNAQCNTWAAPAGDVS